MGLDQHQSPKEVNDNEKWGLFLLALAFLLIAGAVLMGPSQNTRDSSSYSAQGDSLDGPNRGILNKIDTELKDSALREGVMREQLETDNNLSPDVHDSGVGELENVNPLEFNQENHAQKVTEEIEMRARKKQRNTLDERINSKIALDQWNRQYEKQQRDEFVRQFIEKAQKDGFDVQLNENLDVTGLNAQPVEKPIRVPQSMPQTSK